MRLVLRDRFGPSFHDPDGVEAELGHYLCEKTALLARRLEQRDVQRRPPQLQRQAGQSRTSADVDYPRPIHQKTARVEQSAERQRLDDVAPFDRVEVAYRS